MLVVITNIFIIINAGLAFLILLYRQILKFNLRCHRKYCIKYANGEPLDEEEIMMLNARSSRWVNDTEHNIRVLDRAVFLFCLSVLILTLIK